MNIKTILKPEKSGLLHYLKDNDDTDKLYDLDKNHKDDTIINIVQLFHKGDTQKEIKDMIKSENKKFIRKYEDKYDLDFMDMRLFGIDHLSFEWTLELVDKAYELYKKLMKSKKILNFEYSHKSRGFPDLGEGIQMKIASHIRAIKKKSKKRKSKKRNSKRKSKRKKI